MPQIPVVKCLVTDHLLEQLGVHAVLDVVPEFRIGFQNPDEFEFDFVVELHDPRVVQGLGGKFLFDQIEVSLFHVETN